MQHCLATCIIICSRELTDSCREECQEECHVCACAHARLCCWIYSMFFEASCQVDTDCPSPVRRKVVGYTCVCVCVAGCRLENEGGGLLLAYLKGYLWILIERPLCYSLSLSLTRSWIGGSSLKLTQLCCWRQSWTWEAKMIFTLCFIIVLTGSQQQSGRHFWSFLMTEERCVCLHFCAPVPMCTAEWLPPVCWGRLILDSTFIN